jgi:hypothetical protein
MTILQHKPIQPKDRLDLRKPHVAILAFLSSLTAP